MMSRVTESRLVKIVGPLTPSLFNPVKVPGFMMNVPLPAPGLPDSSPVPPGALGAVTVLPLVAPSAPTPLHMPYMGAGGAWSFDEPMLP